MIVRCRLVEAWKVSLICEQRMIHLFYYQDHPLYTPITCSTNFIFTYHTMYITLHPTALVAVHKFSGRYDVRNGRPSSVVFFAIYLSRKRPGKTPPSFFTTCNSYSFKSWIMFVIAPKRALNPRRTSRSKLLPNCPESGSKMVLDAC